MGEERNDQDWLYLDTRTYHRRVYCNWFLEHQFGTADKFTFPDSIKESVGLVKAFQVVKDDKINYLQKAAKDSGLEIAQNIQDLTIQDFLEHITERLNKARPEEEKYLGHIKEIVEAAVGLEAGLGHDKQI